MVMELTSYRRRLELAPPREPPTRGEERTDGEERGAETLGDERNEGECDTLGDERNEGEWDTLGEDRNDGEWETLGDERYEGDCA
jgi:hypothetical protein